MHIENPEYWWLAVGTINACLLWMVALSKIPHTEASYWLAGILSFAGVLNLATSFVRSQDTGVVSLISTITLFLAGTAAFIAASRVHFAMQRKRHLEQWDAPMANPHPAPVVFTEKDVAHIIASKA